MHLRQLHKQWTNQTNRQYILLLLLLLSSLLLLGLAVFLCVKSVWLITLQMNTAKYPNEHAIVSRPTVYDEKRSEEKEPDSGYQIISEVNICRNAPYV